jgi:DNA-binding transcriptional ArsR family regulator
VALTDDITDPRLAKALAHPLRLEILRFLGDRIASPSEISEGIGAPLTNVSYHVRKLRALGLIKLVRKTPKRGVMEHYYSAKPRREVSDNVWAETPPIVKEALIGPVAESTAEMLVAAAHAGGFDRADMHFTRRYVDLDERGWKDVAAVLAGALEELKRIEEEAVERIKATPREDLIRGITLMALCEAPKQSAAPAARPADKRRRPRERSTR